MVKHRLRESIKSLFGSHIDPNKEEQLHVAKAGTIFYERLNSAATMTA